jgi:hypothetical protein
MKVQARSGSSSTIGLSPASTTRPFVRQRAHVPFGVVTITPSSFARYRSTSVRVTPMLEPKQAVQNASPGMVNTNAVIRSTNVGRAPAQLR